jgi:hypothetical protein
MIDRGRRKTPKEGYSFQFRRARQAQQRIRLVIRDARKRVVSDFDFAATQFSKFKRPYACRFIGVSRKVAINV